MKSLKLTIIIAILCSILSACNSADSTQYAMLDADKGWAYGDTLRLLMRSQGKPAAMTLALSHSTDYPYSNIWLEVAYPNGNKTCRDTINIELADVYGRWLGKGFGADRLIELDVTPRVQMPDSSLVKVCHIMRIDTLRGVNSVGITLKPTSSTR
ncbi:MAG: gliding motility lipoprotein GldH [Muribaculaceae bacterium]|nr:gliding motility lipoprotein GldH [Muribaculaceae bacterium]